MMASLKWWAQGFRSAFPCNGHSLTRMPFFQQGKWEGVVAEEEILDGMGFATIPPQACGRGVPSCALAVMVFCRRKFGCGKESKGRRVRVHSAVGGNDVTDLRVLAQDVGQHLAAVVEFLALGQYGCTAGE